MQKLFIFSFFVSICSIQFADCAPITLREAIEIAQNKSPDIRSLENQFDSASAKKRLALSPSEPNLQLQYNDLTKPFVPGSTASTVLQFTQTLGFPGRAFVNRSALDEQAQSLYYQLKASRLQVAFSVKQSYYNLILAQKNIQLNSDQKLAFERILAIAKRRYETGAITQVDYLYAQVDLLTNKNDLADLQANEALVRAQLNILLYNSPESMLEVAPVDTPNHPEIQFETAVSKMLEHRNEILSARHQVSAADRSYKLAWMSLLPDFQLNVGTTFYNVASASPLNSTPEATTTGSWPTHTYMAGVQFTIPIWFLFNEREAIVGASHDLMTAEANLDSLYNQSKSALQTAIQAIHSNRTKIENFEQHLLPMADQAFNAALVSYSAGKVDFQTLSSTATMRRGTRRDYATAIVNYLTNYATYGQLIGEDL